MAHVLLSLLEFGKDWVEIARRIGKWRAKLSLERANKANRLVQNVLTVQ